MAQLPAHAAAAWEEDVLDLDDSDIRLDAPTVSPTSRSHENKPPHPSHHHRVPEPAAAAVQDATRLGSVARSPLAALGHGDVRAPDADFQLPPWLCALQFLGRDRAWEQPGIKAIKDKETLCRAPLVAGVVTSCKQNGLDNLLVTLKDVGSRTKNPTDTVAAAVHKKVLLEGNNNGQDISVGCVILPTKVAVFHPTCKACSLNLNKVIKVLSIPATGACSLFSVFMMIFFERTAHDSASFIDIAEKYKTTALKGHSQEKKKKQKKKIPTGWIGTSTRSNHSYYTTEKESVHDDHAFLI